MLKHPIILNKFFLTVAAVMLSIAVLMISSQSWAGLLYT